MNFQEARKKLTEMAGKEYHTLKYELNIGYDGQLNESCTVYMHSQNSHTHCTWDGALESMERAISGATDSGDQAP